MVVFQKPRPSQGFLGTQRENYPKKILCQAWWTA